MNIVRRGSALAAFGVTTVLLVPMGCEEKIEPVDCNTFCDKEASCYAEVAEALDVKGREVIAKADAKTLKVVADKHRERCMESCNDPNKPKLHRREVERVPEDRGLSALRRLRLRPEEVAPLPPRGR